MEVGSKFIKHKVDFDWYLKVNFSTWNNEALVFWQGQRQNHIALGIKNSQMHFVTNGVPLIVEKYVNDGEIHQVSLSEKQGEIELEVDGMKKSRTFNNFLDENLMNQLNGDDYFLGGLPQNNQENEYFSAGFSGCIYGLLSKNKKHDGSMSYGDLVDFADETLNKKSEGVLSTNQCILPAKPTSR